MIIRKMLRGQKAIDYAKAFGIMLVCKFTDPTEESQESVTIEDAEKIVKEDPSLIYLIIRSPKLEIQIFLETHSLNDLESIGVDYRKSTKNPRKFSLNYNQIRADAKDIRTQECRGLILEADRDCDPSEIVGETQILAYPFRRFFNSTDPNAAELRWSKVKYYEKLDGTLAIVYFDPTLKEWCVATRSVSDADVPFNGDGDTYSSLFLKTWDKTIKYPLETLLCKSFTYMFELCTPENQNVVRQTNYSVTLLGSRSREGLEFPLQASNTLERHIPLCKEIDFKSKSYLDWVNELDLTCEGLVLCDDQFNRVKCKSPAYVLAHKIKDRAMSSDKNLLELILLGKDDDVRGVLDDWAIEKLDRMKEGLIQLIESMNEEFNNGPKETRKDFAIFIQRGSLWMGPQMWRFSNPGKSFLDWIESSKVDGEFQGSFLETMLSHVKRKVTEQ
jgi:hypothetical protein